MLWSLYPAMVVMLPSLWSVGFASGAVSARFVKIYSAASIRSPILLKGVADTGTSTSRAGFLKDGDGGKEAGGVRLAGEGFDEKWEGNCDAEYEAAHEKLMGSCKHLEETFGVRVLGLKITSAMMMEMMGMYATVLTLIVGNMEKAEPLACECSCAAE
jgi:hypothetical protein